MATMNIDVKATGQDVLVVLDRVGKGLLFVSSCVCDGLVLLSQNQMYFWRTEYSIEKLEEATNELKDMLQMAVGTMEEAVHNGWWPLKAQAKGWVRKGHVAIGHADEILSRYKACIGAHPASIIFCPCEALSTRMLNAQAIMRMNQVLRQKVAGEIYDHPVLFEEVAIRRRATDELQTTDMLQFQATLSLMKARASSASMDERIAVLIGLPPVSPSHSLDKPNHGASPLYGSDEVVVPDSPQRPVMSSISNQEEVQIASSAEKISLNAFTKYRTLARSQTYESVPVMIRVSAPRYNQRSRNPIDLVLVLDVSASMKVDGRFAQMQQGSKFVVHNLEERDRLSIVVFETNATVHLALTNMSDEGKAYANQLINALEALGSSNVKAGLEVAQRVLHQRVDYGRVSSIVLLTDGEVNEQRTHGSSRYVDGCPIYSVGMGLKHDPCTLYDLANGSYGTYSYATWDLRSIRDAMALCIGGLTSIVAQDVKVSIHSAHRDVRICDIQCGSYISGEADGGGSGFVTINDLYGSEEKNIIVYVNVPKEESTVSAGTPWTKLLTVAAEYYSPHTGTRVHAETIEISVERPGKVSGTGSNVSVQVAAEILRANVFHGVSNTLSEINESSVVTGDVTRKLDNLRDSISDTEEAKVAKDKWDDLKMDLDQMQKAGRAQDPYIQTGLPYMLSWLSSHRLQRAVTPGSTSKSRWFNFRTTRMQNMIDSVESAPIAYREQPVRGMHLG